MTDQDQDSGQTKGTREALKNLTALQCDLRVLFAKRPTNRALAEVLQRIGSHLDSFYAVVHARMGVHLLSEEWEQAGAEIDSDTREFVNSTLWESISSEEAMCTRLPNSDDGSVLITAVMYDHDIEPSGGAAIVIRDSSKTRVLQALTQL